MDPHSATSDSGSPAWRRWILLALLLIVAGCIFFGGVVYGGRGRPSRISRSAPSPTVLSQQVDLVRQRQDDITSLFNLVLLPLAVITAILGAGGVVGIVLSFRNETRTGQLHDLLYAGTSAQQARTEETHAALLDASQKTLTLVNDTLALARDANDRAAKELSQRAERVLREISEDASSLFLGAYYHQNFARKLLKIIVEEPQIRNEIGALSQRLGSIEGPLEFQEIPLTPSAYLVKGITHHLKQDEKRAIRFLEHAVEAKGELNPKLMQFAFYWMGYACNNVGQYTKAADVFASAKRYTDETSGLYFELSRLEQESHFFELSRKFFEMHNVASPELQDDVGRVLERLEILRDGAASAGASVIAEGIATTEGNINLFLSRTYAGSARNASLDKAISRYQLAGSSLWSRFGLYEAQRERYPAKRVQRSKYADLEAAANSETQKRTEPRSLTLLYLTSVLCMTQQHKPKAEIASATRMLQKTFGDVDGSLTLYSQHWKTNVDRDMFEASDLNAATAPERSATASVPTKRRRRTTRT